MKMISVEKAVNLIKQHISTLGPISIALNKSLGSVLAEDIIAPISLPPFKQSAMDGYAISQSIEKSADCYLVVGEIKAGDYSEIKLREGEAARIFTGAKVPTGATAVVMQENTTLFNHKVKLLQDISPGSNIRPIGEQINAGKIALRAGLTLTPAGIGYLSSLGISRIKVFKMPTVGLIISGNELVKAGNTLKPGQIFESNSSMIVAALKQSGIEFHTVEYVKDELDSTTKSIQKLLSKVDLLLLSGGISVGDYDFVGQAMYELKVEQIFYKVKQKPGKPLFFGKKNKCYLFALPGNPSASLSCFYHYVLPAIRLMSGKKPDTLEKRTLSLTQDYFKKVGRACFLKAKTKANKVEILEGQSSAMLHTFSLADALVYFPAEIKEVAKGTKVTVYMLPYS